MRSERLRLHRFPERQAWREMLTQAAPRPSPHSLLPPRRPLARWLPRHSLTTVKGFGDRSQPGGGAEEGGAGGPRTPELQPDDGPGSPDGPGDGRYARAWRILATPLSLCPRWKARTPQSTPTPRATPPPLGRKFSPSSKTS